jgi:hypothetical protein
MKVEYSKGERASKGLILLNRQSFEASGRQKMKVLLKEERLLFCRGLSAMWLWRDVRVSCEWR